MNGRATDRESARADTPRFPSPALPTPMRSSLAALAFLAVPTSAQVVIDSVPVVYLPGGATVEDCRRQWRTDAAVRAYTAPTFVSEAVRTVDAQRRVDGNDYSESLTAVLQSGLVQTTAPLTLFATQQGTRDEERVVFSAGEEIEVLGIQGEGVAFFTHEGTVYSAEIPGYSIRTGLADEVEVLSDAVRETWVFLVDYGEGRPASWLNVSQAGLVERETTCG